MCFLVKPIAYTVEEMSVPSKWDLNYFNCYKYLASGLCCGLSSLASGMCIGVVGDAGVRGNMQRDIMIAIVLMMIFAEALALYGFITAVILSSG